MSSKKNRSKKYSKPRILVLGSSGAESIRKAGGEPVLCSIGDLRAGDAAAHENIHGLLLMGGGDVDPSLYGGDPKDPTVYGVSEQRDLAEWAALDAARGRGIPVMGICRGAQMMNVHAGGTLHLDIRRDADAHAFHRGRDHRVTVLEGSRVHAAFGDEPKYVVSIHHQAVAEVAPSMVATAWALDGIIETIESKKSWELGVQFHPEMAQGDAHARKLFALFVKACADAAGIDFIPRAFQQEPEQKRRGERMPVTKRMSGRELLSASEQWAADNPTPRRKPAGVRRASLGVKSSWRCFKGCGIRFDDEEDYADHMALLHGIGKEGH